MLSNAYFLAKFCFDTAENEPAKNLQNFANNFPNFANPNPNFANPKVRRRAPRRAAADARGLRDLRARVRPHRRVRGFRDLDGRGGLVGAVPL